MIRISHKKTMDLVAIFVMLSFSVESKEAGSFVDARDNQKYETITYWLEASPKEITDLDEYDTYLKGEPQTFTASFEYGIPSAMTWMAQNLNFEMDESKCKYDSDTNCEPHGRLYSWESSNRACPEGWHLPSDDEWYLLAHLYGGVSEAGKHLKSKDLGGTNESQFNIQKPTIFWSSSELDSVSALDWKVNYRWVKLQRWKGGKKSLNSVRCVRDYSR